MIDFHIFRKLRQTRHPGFVIKAIAMISDSIIPTVVSDYGTRFFCPGYIPYWRAESHATKEPELFKHLRSRHEKVMWDIGANVGTESLYAAQLGIRSYAFEPNPANYYLLSKNIILNHFESMITAFPFAVGNRIGHIESMTDCEYGEADLVKDGDGLKLPIVDPAFLCNQFKVPKPEILKIDVDGTEMDVLRGIFYSSVGERVSFVSIEHDDDAERGVFLERLGFGRIGSDDVNWYYERKI